MASSTVLKSSYHARSVSFPSKSHPIVDQFDEHLCRLRSSQAASSTSSSISHKLSNLNDLYLCVDELLGLPLIKQALAKCGEEVLDGSLSLLDLCDTSRIILEQSKESLQAVQSLIRRKCSGELNFNNDFAEYLKNRKVAKKAIKKCLESIKQGNTNVKVAPITGMLKDVEEITVDVFKCLLSYISGAKVQSRKSGWSMVAKMIHKSGDDQEATKADTSGFDVVDATLDSLVSHKKKSGFLMPQVENLRSQMIKLECEIQDVEEEFQCLSRHLVKTRATILNILSS